MKRKIDLYIEDIKTAIRKIEEYTKEMSPRAFIKDEKTMDAVVRNKKIKQIIPCNRKGKIK